MNSIYYGVENNYIDVTYICYTFLLDKENIKIPRDDNVRAYIFGDHIFGVLKNIKINDIVYPSTQEINIKLKTPLDIDILRKLKKIWWDSIVKSVESPEKKLFMLHKTIRLDYGSIEHELPEQLMAIKYIKPNDIVLELGGNIGRNSCIIATLLNDDEKQLVVLESDQGYAKQLEHNRNKNYFQFNIEASALSEVPLLQKGWDTFVQEMDIIPLDCKKVNTITYSELKNKYNVDFNVLVVDCEGALYQILKDNPDILLNIETVIIENDFLKLVERDYVFDLFIKYGLTLVYNRELKNGPVRFNHCKDTFFQVYTRHL